MRMSGMDLARVTAGNWSGTVPDIISSICTDSRQPEDSAAFLALRGPHHDGHAYAAQAAAVCTALIGDAAGVASWGAIDRPQLVVADTLMALGDIAAAWRQRLVHTTIIAISGSYGKTTVRSMIVHVLAALGFKVATNPANHNNLIGVPQTLLAVPEDAEFAVIECGVSEPGEMQRLAEIVRPDAAIMTGLTSAHGQGLGGMTGVIREKFELLAAVDADGWCVLGTGVQKHLTQKHLTPKAPCIIMDGDDENHVAWSLEGNRLRLTYGAQTAEMRMLLPARHWGEDMALAATVILKACTSRVVTLAAIAEALAGWKPVSGRLHLLPGLGGSTILDDSYNANPSSMQAALDTLAQLDGRRTAILGDMTELGEDSAALHAAMDVSGVDRLILIGEQMHHLAERYPEARWLPDTDAACRDLAGMALGSGDYVLVKASHSMRLQRIVALLARHGEETSRAI
jgi:UDP-N-acetylmuramoyl-tripeptide--D-alanyl-D-alanine ligase